MTGWLFIGIALGLLLAIPVSRAWARRVERRVTASERRAQHAERLAELGTMTGGLAHEIKNPLSTVGLNVQLLQEDVADAQKLTAQLAQDSADSQPQANGPRAQADLQENLGRVARRLDGLHRETQRLRDILEDFLRFAGRMKLDLQPTDVHALLEELTDFFAPQAEDAGVRLRLDLQAQQHHAPADAALLKQAVLNLMLNAVQAMQQAKQATNPVAHGGCDELHLRTSNANDAPGVIVHVTDTGPGIPDEVRPRIFEPYFSNKRGGTGLGLPTTKRIVDEHHGRLTVHSETGQGTAFSIWLPTQSGETARSTP